MKFSEFMLIGGGDTNANMPASSKYSTKESPKENPIKGASSPENLFGFKDPDLKSNFRKKYLKNKEPDTKYGTKPLPISYNSD